MHQICDGYNPRVRMGNWFEQSYSVSQLSRTNPHKMSREAEIDIGYIDAHLKLRPLNRMARLPPWNTTGLVEAPQFQNMHNKTTMKENYQIDKVEHYFRKWKPNLYDKSNGSNKQESQIKLNSFQQEHRLFAQHNVNELLNERQADVSSFKSQLVPNSHQNQKELLQTIYQRDIGEKNSSMNSYQAGNHTDISLRKPDFRRIRSEITLNSVPLIKTYK